MPRKKTEPKRDAGNQGTEPFQAPEQFQFALALHDTNPDVLKKPVQAVHMAITSNVQNKTQRLAWNAMLKAAYDWHADNAGLSTNIYTISRAKLMEMIGYTSPNRKHLRELLTQMMDMKVEWDILKQDGETVWASCVLMPMVSFDNENVYYSYYEEIKNALFNANIYAILDLAIQRRLRLDSSVSLYEWVNRYRKNPTKLTSRMPWQTWRFAIYGPIGEGSILHQYKEFKRDKLKPAIEEINRTSDLTISLIEFKDHLRRVVDLQFTVEEKDLPMVSQGDREANLEWESKLKDLGLNARDRKKLLASYKPEVIEANYNYTLLRIKDASQEPVKSAAAYFKKSIEQGYANEQIKKEGSAQVDPKVMKEIQEEFSASRNKDAAAMFNEMTGQEQEALIEEFNKAQELKELRIPATPSKRTKRFMAPFHAWLAKRTWSEPSAQELLEFALRSGKLKLS